MDRERIIVTTKNFAALTPEDFGKVAVLYGGHSAERDVSLNSGNAVYKALLDQGIKACLIDTNENLYEKLFQSAVDRAFIAVHGRGGEDGTLQGCLDYLNIPYTGSGVKASALAMDKFRSKLIWSQLNLPTPKFVALSELKDCQKVEEQLSFPVIVKPVHEGSSVGIAKVHTAQELESAFETAKQYDDLVLVEQWIDGKEFTVSIVDDEVFSSIGLETDHAFYDYDAKYISNDTRYLLPSGLNHQEEQDIQGIALKAYQALGCQGWSRVDFMQNAEGKFFIIEANTVPGMTDHSLVPMAAAAHGLNFQQLVKRILSTTLS